MHGHLDCAIAAFFCDAAGEIVAGEAGRDIKAKRIVRAWSVATEIDAGPLRGSGR
jgi:hypothetical protein